MQDNHVATSQSTPPTIRALGGQQQSLSTARNKTTGYSPLEDSGIVLPWMMIIVPIALIIIFGIYPFFNTIRLSFTNATMLQAGHFVSFGQYSRMIHDERVWQALLNCVLYVICVVPLMAFLPLVLAALVTEKTRVMNFFRTAFYMPVVLSAVVVGLIWTNLLSSRGLVNSLLKSLHWAHTSIPFLTDRWLLLFSSMTVTVWLGMGYYMVIFLSAIANIDESLYEAAQLDGANVIERFFHVTVPGCRSTISLIVFLSSISAFRVFNEVYVLSNGGAGATGSGARTMTMLIKAEGTGLQGQTGYASALSILMFLILGCMTLFELLMNRRMSKDA